MKKMKLEDLRVESFVTVMKEKSEMTIKGGSGACPSFVEGCIGNGNGGNTRFLEEEIH